jgi:hypothetical protein
LSKLCDSITSKALIACFALGSSFWVHAAEARQLEVSRDGQMYRLYSEMFVASHSGFRSLFARYDAVAKLDADITKEESGANPDGTLRTQTSPWVHDSSSMRTLRRQPYRCRAVVGHLMGSKLKNEAYEPASRLERDAPQHIAGKCLSGYAFEVVLMQLQKAPPRAARSRIG